MEDATQEDNEEFDEEVLHMRQVPEAEAFL